MKMNNLKLSSGIKEVLQELRLATPGRIERLERHTTIIKEVSLPPYWYAGLPLPCISNKKITCETSGLYCSKKLQWRSLKNYISYSSNYDQDISSKNIIITLLSLKTCKKMYLKTSLHLMPDMEQDKINKISIPAFRSLHKCRIFFSYA